MHNRSEKLEKLFQHAPSQRTMSGNKWLWDLTEQKQLNINNFPEKKTLLGLDNVTAFQIWDIFPCFFQSSNSAHKAHPKAENLTTIQRKKNEIFPAQVLVFGVFWRVAQGPIDCWVEAPPKLSLSGLLREGQPPNSCIFFFLLAAGDLFLFSFWPNPNIFMGPRRENISQQIHLTGAEPRG